MKRDFMPARAVILLAVFLAGCFPVLAQNEKVNGVIASRTGEAGGIQLHYLTAGRGPAVILLHGYAETSRMWRPLISQLLRNTR